MSQVRVGQQRRLPPLVVVVAGCFLGAIVILLAVLMREAWVERVGVVDFLREL